MVEPLLGDLCGHPGRRQTEAELVNLQRLRVHGPQGFDVGAVARSFGCGALGHTELLSHIAAEVFITGHNLTYGRIFKSDSPGDDFLADFIGRLAQQRAHVIQVEASFP